MGGFETPPLIYWGDRMLELNSKKLDVKFNGKVYNLRYPFVSELKNMDRKNRKE